MKRKVRRAKARANGHLATLIWFSIGAFALIVILVVAAITKL